MKREFKDLDIKVIATGGLSTLIDSETDCIDQIDRFLTLEGLRIIYGRNLEERMRKLERFEKTR